jgi:hypothetical protein
MTLDLCPPNTDVTISAIYKCHSSVAGGGRQAARSPRRSAAPDRRPDALCLKTAPFVLPSGRQLARLVEKLSRP